jgi:RNA polymerase sigma-70 factor (ECF subfamily)
MSQAIALQVDADPARTALVLRARDGDHVAFEHLIRPGLDRQLRFALSLLGDEMDARDAVQEACLRAWRELPRLRQPSRFDSWLAQILVNHARTVLRRRGRARVREVPVEAVDADAAPTSPGMSMADRVSERDVVRRAFGRLDADKRLVLVLHHVEERSIGEIAVLLRIPEGTVKWRLHAARTALERALEVESR